MRDPIRNLVAQELNNNEVIKLHVLYDLVSDNIEDPDKNQKQQRHQVRSVLDGWRRSGKVSRVAAMTYKRTVETI